MNITASRVAITHTATGAVAVFASRDMDPAEREAWMEWDRRHQIDLNEFTIPNFIEVDRVNRTVRWLAYDLHSDHGGRFVDPNSDGKYAAVSVRSVQLDFVPEDFPELS